MVLKVGDNVIKVVLLKIVSSMQQEVQRAEGVAPHFGEAVLVFARRVLDVSGEHGVEIGSDVLQRVGGLDGLRARGGGRGLNGCMRLAHTLLNVDKLTSNEPLDDAVIQWAQRLGIRVRVEDGHWPLVRAV